MSCLNIADSTRNSKWRDESEINTSQMKVLEIFGSHIKYKVEQANQCCIREAETLRGNSEAIGGTKRKRERWASEL